MAEPQREVKTAEAPAAKKLPEPVAKRDSRAAAAEPPREAPVSAPPIEVEVTAAAKEEEIKPIQESKKEGKPVRDENIAVLKKGLATTRGGFISRLANLFIAKKAIDPELLTEIEEVLITADVGTRTAATILSRLQTRMQNGELRDEESVWQTIRAQAREILSVSAEPIRFKNRPAVFLVVGVNGVGKTTTIGKLAHRFKDRGKKVLLAAGDTFRAAAVLQLEVWGRRVECPVVKGKEHADPSSVIFDAVKKATDEGFDLVIADTAGRLHTKVPLMEELKKVSRTVSKALNGQPADEILLILDATIGQNAVQQAQMFKEALEISGIVLTKLDGTAKGGVILGVVDEHRIPVRFVGLGERLEDLREFNADEFVEALFAKPEEGTIAA